MKSEKRWVRLKDAPIAGVCGGIAKALDMNPTLMRLIWIIAFFCFGLSLFTYLALWFVMPREDKQSESDEPMFLGVCLRLAQKLEVEVSLVRAFAILSPIPTLGVTIILYFVGHFLLPKNKPATN